MVQRNVIVCLYRAMAGWQHRSINNRTEDDSPGQLNVDLSKIEPE